MAVATIALERPDGTLTAVFTVEKAREGAYRLIENKKVSVDEVAHAAHEACLRRANEFDFVFVPIDGSALSMPSCTNTDELGPVGASNSLTRGLEVMSAIAVSPKGTPLGVCGQRFWCREEEPNKKQTKGQKNKRPLAEKETRHWLDVQEQAIRARDATGSRTRLWFQADRGADFREELHWATVADVDITVRAAQDRKTLSPEDGYLFDVVAKAPLLGTYQLEVPAGPKRVARRATIEVRAAPVVIHLPEAPVELFAVHALEVSELADGQEPIEWTLLTNRRVSTFAQARLVIFGYTQRWRIEEVHKTWKSVCHVERSAIQEQDHLERWATILFAVAVRIERLKQLAREQPDLPADVEFSQWEIRALQLERDLVSYRRGVIPTIGQLVRWVADLGGYTGKSSGGPPGSITIGRGLQRLAQAATTLASLARAQQ